MYTGVVFDFDGVLYDSEKHWEDVENRYLLARMPNWDPADHKYLLGRPVPEVYAFLRDRGLAISEVQYAHEYHQMAMQLYASVAKPLENIDALLHALVERGAKIAIASSSKRVWIDTALLHNKLAIPIDNIVCGDDASVARGKPAPDIYLRAAELLHEDASRLIAIEDSKNGVASAKAAGLYCFGLRNGFNEQQDLSLADAIITGFGAPSITKIVGLLQ